MIRTSRAAADLLVKDLGDLFGDRLRSVVAYGPHLDGEGDAPMSCLAVVDSLTVEDLQGCAARSGHWARAGLAVPLFVTGDDFARSLDAFPLEYGEIMRVHERVFGDDPFAGISVAPADLRRACEVQAKSHLLHLREGFIEAGGRPGEITRLVTASAPAFAALLRNVARLGGAATRDRVEAAREGARTASLPDAVVTELLDLERRPGVAATDGARIFPEYLAAVEQLVRVVDGWRH